VRQTERPRMQLTRVGPWCGHWRACAMKQKTSFNSFLRLPPLHAAQPAPTSVLGCKTDVARAWRRARGFGQRRKVLGRALGPQGRVRAPGLSLSHRLTPGTRHQTPVFVGIYLRLLHVSAEAGALTSRRARVNEPIARAIPRGGPPSKPPGGRRQVGTSGAHHRAQLLSVGFFLLTAFTGRTLRVGYTHHNTPS